MIPILRSSASRLLAITAASTLIALMASRLLLLAWFADRWVSDQLCTLLVLGLRVDLIVVGILLSVPVLLWPLLAWARTAAVWWVLARAWIGVIALAMLLLEVSTPSFLLEYEARPNHLAVEYLRDWDSILPMLWTGFRVPLLTGAAVLGVGSLALVRWLLRRPSASALPAYALLLWPLLIAGDVLLIRGTLDHRPANPAMFARWPDQMLNQLALNSAYSFGYAVYALRHERSAADVYGRLDDAELLAWLREDPRFSTSPQERPSWHRQSPRRVRERPLNLIVVVEESLGADFSARLGGRGLTPELDRWASRGIWFERIYATGTRSARGLEAIVAGFPPSPAPAVLKREKAQEDFATLASVLGEAGYRSRFIYGGGAHFDNMRGFFLGNGFDQVIERGDFVNPRHVGSWGVSDEDLFERALAETDAAVARGERFFHLVFSSSHHEPFDFPPGRLPSDAGEPGSADGAVRYADFALGRFLDDAARRPWFADTLLLVVADHDVRVYGDAVIPLRRFQIPALIVGADVEPLRVRSLASQIDLAPTLLSLAGVDAWTPFPGRDLLATLPEFGVADGPEPRALMQFDDRFAWLTDGELLVLHAGGVGERWVVTASGEPTSPAALSEPQRRRLLAKASLGDWLYARRAYALGAASSRPPSMAAARAAEPRG
ncbi:LTA synthase family protein [Sinimarinibacterium thermocellulolyticum]|uniref:LTA synthase family protein n=1 Tax=Sinimarinibacterium thermocellulolyticum TaxID=3170016 RepID=A0ABV2ABV8_9GAMM